MTKPRRNKRTHSGESHRAPSGTSRGKGESGGGPQGTLLGVTEQPQGLSPSPMHSDHRKHSATSARETQSAASAGWAGMGHPLQLLHGSKQASPTGNPTGPAAHARPHPRTPDPVCQPRVREPPSPLTSSGLTRPSPRARCLSVSAQGFHRAQHESRGGRTWVARGLSRSPTARRLPGTGQESLSAGSHGTPRRRPQPLRTASVGLETQRDKAQSDSGRSAEAKDQAARLPSTEQACLRNAPRPGQ